MNKFNSIFEQILQIFLHQDFVRAVRDAPLDNPFETPPIVPAAEQLFFQLR